MRLRSLWIHRFKNLVDVTINFDESSLVALLIGQNTTAKSNLLEALVWIFRNLDLGEDPRFRFCLEYTCRGRNIKIDASRKGKVEVTVNGEPIPYRSFLSEARGQYLPNNVFGYYSGPSTRLEHLFDEHQDRFYRQLLKGERPPFRPLFYARPIHSQYVLLAFFSSRDKLLLRILNDTLNIIAFKNATFKLKQPIWYKPEQAKKDLFWGAKGVVHTFLEDLRSLAQVSEKTTERVRRPMRRPRPEERLSLRIPDLRSLRSLASRYRTNVEFFKMLESTYISDLIQELTIEVKKRGVKPNLEFRELSEGEQQLLTVLGLLRFTREDESLFLLDEPDTHLNPAWKLQYVDLLQKVVGENQTIHLLVVTHDPFLVAGLKKEQIQVFSLEKADSRVVVRHPEEDAVGMGVAALLTSDMFGWVVPTTLDLATQRKLDRKGELATREHLTEEESVELSKLDDELARMGFLSTFRDPLYSKFLKALKDYDQFNRPALTKEEREEQIRIARDIVAKLKREER